MVEVEFVHNCLLDKLRYDEEENHIHCAQVYYITLKYLTGTLFQFTVSAFNKYLKDLFSLSEAVHVMNFGNPYILHGKHRHIQLSQMCFQPPDSI